MSSESKSETNFDTACETLEAILAGPIRRDIVRSSKSLSAFRESMRAGTFRANGRRIDARHIVAQFDRLARRDGFHVLNDWDGVRETLNEDTIPVDVVSFMIGQDVADDRESTVRAILLDYYFFYVLALLTLRVWDTSDANKSFDRIDRLLQLLQGPTGSGQRFAAGAETLLLVAVSHYESDEAAYDGLLAKIKTLDREHREKFALVLAAIFGSHLRFGFEATYGRDVMAMRKDNGPDYPWLLFALVTLMEAYDRGARGERIVEGLVNGLSPDPRAFIGRAPDSLASYEVAHVRFRSLFEVHRDDLLLAFERHRPGEDAYSPVAFYFNFLHNTLKAIVVDALLRGEPSSVGIDDLLTAFPESESQTREAMARKLMGYAKARPDRIRGQWVPVIVYDPRKGRRAFTEALRRLTK